MSSCSILTLVLSNAFINTRAVEKLALPCTLHERYVDVPREVSRHWCETVLWIKKHKCI